MDQGKKITIAGTILVSLFAAFLFLILLLNFVEIGSIGNQLEYFGLVILTCGSLYTSVHLWSRMASFDEGTSIRTLFKMMGGTFIPISLVFIYFLLDGFLLEFSGLPKISSLVGGIIEFGIFGIEGSMAASDVLWFALIMIGISFYIMPLERFVKGRKPYFAISLWLCLIAIPILIFFRGNPIIVAIAVVITVLILVINFIFMFYLYISLAVKSAGKMRSASVLVAFGLILMIMIWIMNLLLQGEQYGEYIVMGLGVTSLLFFNIGFRIMK